MAKEAAELEQASVATVKSTFRKLVQPLEHHEVSHAKVELKVTKEDLKHVKPPQSTDVADDTMKIADADKTLSKKPAKPHHAESAHPQVAKEPAQDFANALKLVELLNKAGLTK